MENEQEIGQLLMREYLFQALSAEQVKEILEHFELQTFDRECPLFTQGDEPAQFYIVYTGKIRIVHTERRGAERQLNLLGSGDFFGEEALILNRPQPDSAIALERSQVLCMSREQFFNMLDTYPDMALILRDITRSRQVARRVKFKWLGADEIIYLVHFKHDIFLITSLFVPILLIIVSIPILVFTVADPTGRFYKLGLWSWALLFVGAIIWSIWKWLDFGNDYYILTNKRVLWLEKVVGLYDSRREAPLDSVLAVDVKTVNFLARRLDFGEVNVRTYTGGILMQRMARPYQFASFVDGYKNRALIISKAQDLKTMEQELEQALLRHIHPTLETLQPRVKTRALKPQPIKREGETLREQLKNFLKVRYERNGAITYRKHWWVLLKKAWLPLLLLTVLLSLVFFLAYRGVSLPWELYLCSAMLFGTILFFWLWYAYLDWRNDIYRITPDSILDIEKRPLGKEEKKTAKLDAILSIEHVRANIIGILLNFGNVVINVGNTKFNFNGVYNPDQVHQDVSDFREALNRKKRMEEAARERERMINWFITFYDENEKYGVGDLQQERERVIGKFINYMEKNQQFASDPDLRDRVTAWIVNLVDEAEKY